MANVRAAFWNLQNLFNATPSEIAADLEFTPASGWTGAVVEAKVNRLAEVVKLMHAGQGPDLLGVCEVETKELLEAVRTAAGRPDLEVAHVDSPDLRGIDVSLLYSRDVLELDGAPTGHVVHLRYATRDIFEVPLRVKANGAALRVLVNHWPSRRQGAAYTEPFRITVAEHCGRLVDRYLKMSRDEVLALPNAPQSLQQLNDRWNRNVLVMGDFNDEPFDRSVFAYLLATRDLDLLEEEIRRAGPGKEVPEAAAYLGKKPHLFNCMWEILARPDSGSFFFASGEGTPSHTMNMLDQFLVSRGLYFGRAGLRIDIPSVKVSRPGVMATPKGRPRPFDRDTGNGTSDHFPIECVLATV
jgi:hypothetical protein